MTVQSSLKSFDRSREEFRKRSLRAEKSVRPILDAVRKDGDKAVLRFTRRWDQANLKRLTVSEEEFESARGRVDTSQRLILEAVFERFQRFYASQKLRAVPFVDDTGFYSERVAPLDRVGLYVPGGRAPLISTLMMLAIPARVAGVPERYVATPPQPDGKIPPLLLEAARMADATAVFKMGGAQALAAFAYGTRTVPKVDKVFGPGNVYVTAAKKLLFGEVGVDLLAGPSELVIIADESASPQMLVQDLLAQAEHGPDSLSLLLTTSGAIAAEVRKGIAGQNKSLIRQIFVVQLKTIDDCVAAASEAAPEHLSLAVAEPEKWIRKIGPAGAIFLGSTAIAYGDYIAGPNHTLPTAGAARFSSPLSLESFFRRSSILNVRDADGELARLGAAMADWEGLRHHAQSLRLRADK